MRFYDVFNRFHLCLILVDYLLLRLVGGLLGCAKKKSTVWHSFCV